MTEEREVDGYSGGGIARGKNRREEGELMRRRSVKTALVDSKNKIKCLVAAEKYCQLLMSVYLVDKTQSNRRQLKKKKKVAWSATM